MADLFHYIDDLGPAKILHLHEGSSGLKGIVVVDNVAAGPAIGGVRMAPDVSLEECLRLARAMTLKNGAAGLPHGGGKSVIAADPKLPPADKERIIRAFAQAIRNLVEYIPGPDMGTNEACMAWVADEIGRSVGLPPELGGIPLDRIGATGLGLAAAIEAAVPFSGIKAKGARVAVQGFGSVGKHAARFLVAKGAILVAVADTAGMVQAPEGLDVAALIALKDAGRSVRDHDAGRKGNAEEIVGTECDIWIPAARPDVLRADNIDRLRTKLVVQGANIPATAEAEAAMHRRGILSIPDFIANAGGVICAAVEYRGGSEGEALRTIEDKVRTNTAEVLQLAATGRTTPRAAAMELAKRRVVAASAYRRRF